MLRYTRQILTQILIYFIEIIAMSVAISKIFDINIKFAYAIYQIFVLVILTNINSIKKDELLAYTQALQLGELYINNRYYGLVERTINNCTEMITNKKILNSPKIKNKYKKLIINLRQRNIDELKEDLILANHEKELIDLEWRYSFLLRLIK